MIVPMVRVFVASTRTREEELLKALADLRVLHLEPVDPRRAVPDPGDAAALSDLDRALQILASVAPAWEPPRLEPLAAAREIVRLHQSFTEKQARLERLRQQAHELGLWGRVRLSGLAGLRKAGVEVQFFSIPASHVEEVEAECVEAVGTLPHGRVLIAVIHRKGEAILPEWAEAVPLPDTDLPSVQETAARVDQEIQDDLARLSRLAGCVEAIQQERDRLDVQVQFSVARGGGLQEGTLFALQGWCPLDEARNLASSLEERGIPSAVRVAAASEEESPPTLIRYPPWVRPIRAVLDMLGTLPGYRELDLSPFFMVALPLFAAMLIGDAGYGLILAGAGALFYMPLSRSMGRAGVQMLIIVGLATLLWGVLTANYFGVTPETLARQGGVVQDGPSGPVWDQEALAADQGFYGQAARVMWAAAPLWKPDPRENRTLIMKISLVVGCLHLILAHLRALVAFFPVQRALAEAGWILILGTMFVVIWHLVFVDLAQMPRAVWWILAGGMACVAWFARPGGPAMKRLMVGLGSSLLPFLGTFSDTMSYLRLFAVGMASYHIAAAFNTLAWEVAGVATWFVAAGVLVFGHALNVGLAFIAIFAHGVRLNMLEFSNNAGVQWAGYAYRPFGEGHVHLSMENRS